MEFLSQLERTVLGWYKSIPHLPVSVQKWLSDNVWWMAAIAAVLSGIGALGFLSAVFGDLASLTSSVVSYYASTTFVTWVVIKTIIALVFLGLECLLFAFAVTPLKEKQKKGWVLLFTALLLSAISVFVNAILTLNAFSFVTDIIFGALSLAVGAYFLFEIHGQFAHVERSKGVKAKKKTTE
ncbi:MAG: hypothetical protein ACOH18_01710 [Candidatus Saccharimonadaceae bacterium]